MNRRDLFCFGAAATLTLGFGARARAEESLKLVVVGDSAVGKTSMLMSYVTNSFPGEYLPTVFDNHTARVSRAPHGEVALGLWDTAGAEDYDRLRPLSYPEADLIVLCFSIVSPSSTQSVSTRWMDELGQHASGVPILLVGTKTDLRGDSSVQRSLAARGEQVVQPGEGADLADAIGARAYRECSALTQDGLKAVFDTSIDLVLGRFRRIQRPVDLDLEPGRLLRPRGRPGG